MEGETMIHSLKKTGIVARFAFLDLIRERILYNIFFVSLLLLFFGYLAALLVFGHQDRVMLHMGSMVNALSIYFVSASAGARTLYQEMDQRFCYLPLSRPVSRVSYFYGKWLGIGAFSLLNLLLLMTLLGFGLQMTGGGVKLAFFQSFALIWIESLMIAGLTLFLSLFLRPGLSIMVCFSFLFISHNHEQLEFLRNQSPDPSVLLSLIEKITPNASAFLLDTRIYYELPLTVAEFAGRMGYGAIWALCFVAFGSAVFYRKNL